MGRFIETQNWAIMPGEVKPENGVAEACAGSSQTIANGSGACCSAIAEHRTPLNPQRKIGEE